MKWLSLVRINPPAAKRPSTLHVRVRGLRAEAGAACVPAEVMQLIIVVGEIQLADNLTILGGMRVYVNDAHGAPLPTLADVEQAT